MVCLAQRLPKRLQLAKVSGFRHPVTSITLAIILMLFLVTLNWHIDLFPSNVLPSSERVKPAGAMGPIYLQVVREGMAACSDC